MEAKVKEVTLLLEETGVPSKDNEEEEAQSSILLALEKELSGYGIRVLETIEFLELTYRFELTTTPTPGTTPTTFPAPGSTPKYINRADLAPTTLTFEFTPIGNKAFQEKSRHYKIVLDLSDL